MTDDAEITRRYLPCIPVSCCGRSSSSRWALGWQGRKSPRGATHPN